METLNTFQVNDQWRLFELAKELDRLNFFLLFLTDNQYVVLSFIISLNNETIWKQFIEGNCALKIIKSVDTNSERNDEHDEVEAAFEDGHGFLTALALQVRFLLWEKAIDFYYANKELDKSINTIDEVSADYEIMDRIHNLKKTGSGDPETEEIDKETKPRNEDDDYDDDEDDEEGNKPASESKEDKMDVDQENSGEKETEMHYDGQNHLMIEVPIGVLQEKLSESHDQRQQLLQPHHLPLQSQLHSSETSKNGVSNAQNVSLLQRDLARASPSLVSRQGTSASSNLSNINAIESQERLIVEFNKVYHNFEYDRDTLIKRRKLEASDKQLEESSSSGGPVSSEGAQDDSKQDHLQLGINFGTASHSLKHLLKTIQNKREDIELSDFELRNLFMDVRKNRGKWANDERVGQEELYEACEKVVVDLRGYTEHSTPFLNKVSKREAPNYNHVIKKPMDLNTVMKKLKAFQYDSKKEFVDDLMLIWSNCLTYNADPKHFLRAHAIAMQKRTLKLIPSIPDITIRSRAEVEKEEEEPETKSTEVVQGKALMKGRKRSSKQDANDPEVKLEETPEVTLEKEKSVTGTPIAPVEETSVGVGSSTIGTAAEEETVPATKEEPQADNSNANENDDEDDDDENGELADAPNEENGEEVDFELQAWRSMTSKSRANYCAKRADLFDSENKLRPDAIALLRQPYEMNTFQRYLTNLKALSKSSNLLDNDEPYLLEYDIMGGLPGIPYAGLDELSQEKQEQKLVDHYLHKFGGDASKIKSSFVLSTDQGLNKTYTGIITLIQEIRKICFKISLIRQMQTQQFIHHTQMKPPEMEAIREIDVDPASRLPSRDAFTQVVQYPVLRRAVGKIAMQTGFESTEPFAINSLTQLAERYFESLVKTMKLHTETTSPNRMTKKEALLASLLENGVNKPDDLYTFVLERVVKQEGKLKDLKDKLSNFLKELLRPGLENFSEKSFNDNSEQFMTGDFSSDLGDDFFGFRELGLDKEYRMLSSSIPIYLLHSRLHNNYSSNGEVGKKNKYEDLLEMEDPKLYASDISKQVGVLLPFYNKLLDKTKTHYIKSQKKKGESTEYPGDDYLFLIEDEELPQKQRNIRPRLPPTGKIASVKKKLLSSGFFLDEEPSNFDPEVDGVKSEV